MESLNFPSEVRFFLALALGFLIGLERESSGLITKGRVFAGVRTYSLISAFGFGCAWLFEKNVTLALPVGLIAVAALALVGYLAKLRQGHIGWTSEVAALLTFVVGGLCLLGEIWVPMALGIVATFLLSEKAEIEHYVERLDKAEFLAVVKFLLVTVIILPVLPDAQYTQFKLNPRHIWQIVVIVSAIGFGGYILAKKLGDRLGLWAAGILGGIVSSTAVSITMGRLARQSPALARNALAASIMASSVMYLRILVIIWLVKPLFVPHLALSLVLLSAVGMILAFYARSTQPSTERPAADNLQNPFEIRPALLFAGLFVILSVVTSLVRSFYGSAGLLVLAFASGVTDIDPFILSLVDHAETFQTVVVTAVLVAMAGNTVMKGIYFGALSPEQRRACWWRYGLWAVLHLPLILIG